MGPPLSGRDAAWARTDRALRDAADGRGAVIGVTGPAGIGRSALLAAVIGEARARGFSVCDGRCRSGDARLSLAPLIDALGAWLRDLSPADRAERTRGLEPLAAVLFDLGLTAPAPLADPNLERTRLLEAIARLVDRAAVRSPVLFAMDDLHHADPDTLDAIRHLGRRVDRQRLLVLLSTRDEGAPDDLWTAPPIPLDPLSEAALGELAYARLGGPAPAPLAAMLAARTGGNPRDAVTRIDQLLRDGSLREVHGAWVLEARAEAPPALDPDAAIADRARRALALWDLGRGEEAERELERAIAEAGPADEIADALHAQAVFAGRRRDRDARDRALERLRALAEDREAPRIRAIAALAEAAAEPVHTTAIAILDRARAHALEAGELALIARADDQVAVRQLYRGDLVAVGRWIARGLALADQAHAPVLAATCRMRQAIVDLLAGRSEAAESGSHELLAAAWGIGGRRMRLAALGVRAMVLADRGDVGAAEACLVEAEALGVRGDQHVGDTVRLARLELAWIRGEPAGDRAPDSEIPALRVGWARLRVAHGLPVTAPDIATHAPDGWPGIAAAHAKALAAGDGPALVAVADRYDALGLGREANRARCDSGLTEPVTAALRQFERTGAACWAVHARGRLRALGRRVAEPRVPRTHGLSPRELEVALQVARGLTSAEIGRALFISTRTVTTHLDHVYRRLELAGRDGLIAYLREHGLI